MAKFSHQDRRIAGWWLDVPAGELFGDNPRVASALSEIHETFEDAVAEGRTVDFAPTTQKEEEREKRIYRLREALAGTAMQEIAETEGSRTGAVSSVVKDSVTRLKVARHRQALDSED